MVKKVWFLLCISILLSGCTAVGLGIGILHHEGTEYKTIYQLELLRELEPGTEVKIELNNDESVKGTFLYIEEFYRSGYFSENGSDSLYQKGYWEIMLNVSGKEELFTSNEVKMVEEFYEEGNYAAPIGLGIGMAVDVLLYFLYKNIRFKT